jgi:hypothetical protein
MATIRGHHYIIAALVVIGAYYGFKHYKTTGKLY